MIRVSWQSSEAELGIDRNTGVHENLHPQSFGGNASHQSYVRRKRGSVYQPTQDIWVQVRETCLKVLVYLYIDTKLQPLHFQVRVEVLNACKCLASLSYSQDT